MTHFVESLINDLDYRGVLPAGFGHGYATAAYQIEGAVDKDGRGPCVWDKVFKDFAWDGKDACNSYEQWKDDVALLKQFGSKVYRFSISWSRIIPNGAAGQPVNEKGIQYYNSLIDALLTEGIQPIVTLFHFDTPLALEEKYKGWTCDDPYSIVNDFINYARICFERFGDRVKTWATINEPYVFTVLTAQYLRKNFGRSDFYRIGFRLLLAHGFAGQLYHQRFQPTQNGVIGIVIGMDWSEPIDDSGAAKTAAHDALQRGIGWFADPIFNGVENEVTYNTISLGHRHFTPDELKVIHRSSDYFGLNSYGTAWTTGEVCDPLGGDGHWPSIIGGGVKRVFEKDGKLIGKRGKNGHPHMVPWGFRKIIAYCWSNYAQFLEAPIKIMENGYPIDGEADLPFEAILDDKERQEYFNEYVKALCDAVVKDGAVVDTYCAWSLMDNLEWEQGYTPRFGVALVDTDHGFKRHPKNSSKVLQRIWHHVVRAAD